LQQVLLNLYSNALKFTTKGSITITCTQTVDEESNLDSIRISVKDTGVGISEEEQNKLFQLFGTIQRTSQQNTKGIGLGLVISKTIVNNFGGKIDVNSTLG